MQAVPGLPDADLYAELDVRTVINADVSREGQLVGVLSAVTLGEAREFTPDELALLQGLADQAGLAITNARLYETEQRARRIAEALAHVAMRLNAQLDLPTVLQTICEETARALEFPASSVSLYDEKREAIFHAANIGLPAGYLERAVPTPHAIHDEYTRLVGDLVVVPDIQAVPGLPNADLYTTFAMRTVVTVRMARQQQLIGILSVNTFGQVRPVSEDEKTMLRGLAAQATQAITNARLFETVKQELAARKQAEEQIQQNAAQLQDLSRRLVEAQENERRLIARELHDEIGQVLTSLKILIEMVPKLPAEAARARLQQAQDLTGELIESVSRMSLDLRPPMLDDLGLLPALLWHFNRFTKQTDIKVDFKHSGLEGKRFAAEVETAAYRIVQEALTNIARHAGVKEAAVRLKVGNHKMELQIEDQGRGLDAEAALVAGRGMSGMCERAHLLGGELKVISSPGKGTRLEVEIPLGGGQGGLGRG